MNRLQIETLLKEVSEGRATTDEALERLKDLPFEDLGFAKRSIIIALLRTGMPGDLCRGKDNGAGCSDLRAHGECGRKRVGHTRLKGCL